MVSGVRDPGRRGRWRKSAAVSAAALIVPFVWFGTTETATAADDCSTVAWMDHTRSPRSRAAALLAASTQHQKYRWLVEQPANSPQQTDFSGVIYPAQLPCTPTVVYTDGPDGVRFTEGVHRLPGPHRDGVDLERRPSPERKGEAQAAEAFDKGKNVVLGPGLAGGRTPLSGRTPEYFGEDPLLTGLLDRRHGAGTRERQPRQAGDVEPEALRGQRAGARSASSAPRTSPNGRCARSTSCRSRSR